MVATGAVDGVIAELDDINDEGINEDKVSDGGTDIVLDADETEALLTASRELLDASEDVVEMEELAEKTETTLVDID